MNSRSNRQFDHERFLYFGLGLDIVALEKAFNFKIDSPVISQMRKT